jgi:hypothetical protein
MSKVTVYAITVIGTPLQTPLIEFMVAIGGAADMDGNAVSTRCVENDAKRKSSIPFAVAQQDRRSASRRTGHFAL